MLQENIIQHTLKFLPIFVHEGLTQFSTVVHRYILMYVISFGKKRANQHINFKLCLFRAYKHFEKLNNCAQEKGSRFWSEIPLSIIHALLILEIFPVIILEGTVFNLWNDFPLKPPSSHQSLNILLAFMIEANLSGKFIPVYIYQIGWGFSLLSEALYIEDYVKGLN